MYAGDPQLTASQVLRTFHHDELYLFLGAAFTTLGLMSASFPFLQRKFDAMLFWLALFAILYGQRLWLQLGLLTMMVPPSAFFENLKVSSNYLVPIPGFFYFAAAGFLGRSGRKIAIALAAPFLCIFVGTFLFGPKQSFKWINSHHHHPQPHRTDDSIAEAKGIRQRFCHRPARHCGLRGLRTLRQTSPDSWDTSAM